MMKQIVLLKIVKPKLSNSQIVEQLKRHFNSQGTATADDILNGVINDAKDKTSD